MLNRRSVAALAVGAIAFALYHATLLPGVDFGDTGSFQTAAGELTITPRDGYPLYFAIGNLFVWTVHGDHAHALNLASAAEGAAAAVVLTLAAAELSGSAAAGAAAALIFVASYTFWSQAIIAEVYSLHIFFVGLTLLLLLGWERHPTTWRLACFFAAYALGFGNHLSMILLLPGYAAFLLVAAPGGWRSMIAPRVVLLATAIAAAGALQYLWNLRGLWLWPHPPHGLSDALQTFWFDVTKTDWRDTMVLRVPASALGDRAAMYWFDLGQQFGWTWLLAPIGLARLLVTNRRRGVLMALLYAVNVAFAFSYNVGDTHVFYLPSHAALALLFAPAVTAAATLASGAARRHRRAVRAAAAVVATVAFVRMFDDYPALDRSDDTRPADVLARLTSGLDPLHDVLLEDLNWQVQNGLSYYGKELRPGLAYARMPDVLLYAPVLVRDNLLIGRDVVLSAGARDAVEAAYGPLLPTEVDPRVNVPTIDQLATGLPEGTRYALCVLKPTREFRVDADDLASALRRLTGRPLGLPSADYVAVAGTTGRPPDLLRGSARPFRGRVALDGVPVEVRMESWLSADTIRRMGFAQVIAARRHVLIVQRGVSFVAFDGEGRPIRSGYAAGIFAPEARYRIARAIVGAWKRPGG